MSSSTQVILLERVEKLGELGEIVNVKPGYARNYLLPQKKALRASKENAAYFEAQKKVLEAKNEENKTEAKKLAQKIEGLKVSIIRQASEAGQLFGSVASRDISEAVTKTSKQTVTRSMVDLNQNIKTIGLMPISIILHPEVKVDVIINIARSVEEAEIQAKTGRALIAGSSDEPKAKAAPVEEEVAAEEEAEASEATEEVVEEATEEKTEAAEA